VFVYKTTQKWVFSSSLQVIYNFCLPTTHLQIAYFFMKFSTLTTIRVARFATVVTTFQTQV